MVAYDSRAACIALMYRLPTAPEGLGSLACHGPGAEPVSLQEPVGEVLELSPRSAVELLASRPTGRFGRVVLHWVLDTPSSSGPPTITVRGRREILREARRLLAPGGVVAGCVRNVLDLPAGHATCRLGVTPGALESLLEDAGFGQVRCLVALPSADAPRTLVTASTRAARHYFKWLVARDTAPRSVARRWGRQFLAETGLYRYLRGSLVFTGRVPC